MSSEKIKKNVGAVNAKEQRLLNLIRETEFGEIKIIVQDKQPIRVEEVKKSIKL